MRSKILEMIRNGAGEDFLQEKFEQGHLGFLEDMWDLKGVDVFQEDIVFPAGDSFEAIDFSHAHFYHSKFTNAVFNCAIEFAKVYNCEFRRCIFYLNSSYGTAFEKVRFVECEFVGSSSFTNCEFREVTFEKCFVPNRLFFECKFDQRTSVEDTIERPIRMNAGSVAIDPKNLAEMFNGIKEAYRAGEIPGKTRQYFFRQMQAATRHNSGSPREKGAGLAKEYIAGYGVRPGRVLLTMLAVLLLSTVVFSAAVGPGDGFVLAAGGLFTFGGKADLLGSLHVLYRAFYVWTAFIGISLTALFITVLANVWFREY